MKSLRRVTLASTLLAVLAATSTRASDIHADFRDVRHFRGDYRPDRRDLAADWRDIHRDRAEIRHDLQSGDYAAARAERQDLRNDYRNVLRDRGDLDYDGGELGANRRDWRRDVRDLPPAAQRDVGDIRGDLRNLRKDERAVARDRRDRREDVRKGDSQAAQVERQELGKDYGTIRNDRSELRADWHDLHDDAR